ncbi:MAG: PDZ domain-containing protein [Planctomycetes bacterium]|nr:PDZ domain-containing protein [Planctomycetota bacterium]
MNLQRLVLVSAVAFALAAAFALRLGAQDAAPPREEVDALLRKLGSSDPLVRDEATAALRKLGPAAVPALQEAAQSGDAEVATRAGQLLREIEKPQADAADRAASARGRAGRGRGPGWPGGLRQGFSVTFGGPGSVQIQQDANGHVRVAVTQQKDGKSITEVYEADSAEEFKQKYPEIAKKYGVGGRGGFTVPGFDMHIFDPFNGESEDLDQAGKDFQKRLQESLSGGMQGLGKEIQEMLRRLERELQGGRRRRAQPREEEQSGEDLLPPDEDESAAAAPPMTDPGSADAEDADAADPDEDADQPAAPPQPQRRSGKAPRPATPLKPAPRELGLGVEFIEPALQAHLGLGSEEGVLVNEVKPDSLAERTGFSRYDVILSIDGRPVTTHFEFRRMVLEALAAGKDFSVELIRGGKRQTLVVKSAPAAEPK